MTQQPIELYYWPTPNGHKISIMLEELQLPYEVHPVDITRGEQFEPEFLRISPNNKMPAIVDPAGPDGKPLPLFESGAILLYLAEKTGHFIPSEPAAYYRTLQWLMFQMGGVGPMAGQAHHFRNYAPEKIDYAIERYTNEVARLYRVLDRRLAEVEYLAGEYSIADIATWPWVRSWKKQGQDIEALPNVKRWLDTIGERPAVQKGIELLADKRQQGKKGEGFDQEAWEVLFGKDQYQQR
ncbi:MAG: glutathione S-transferase N-terminal domain-containing protein [Halofilum sp. (in: g-proteobacteria)]|nr:glutathione S-transferase N-terminal domain-containing protein [Halofilum sp. (in: g-proteobacteria)]